MVQVKDYTSIRNSYDAIKNSSDITKDSTYFTSIDTASGSNQDAKKIASKVMQDLNMLDAKNKLCISVKVQVKHNKHDLGSYYSVDLYIVDIEVDDDSNIYNVVDDYNSAGIDQLETIIAKYSV